MACSSTLEALTILTAADGICLRWPCLGAELKGKEERG